MDNTAAKTCERLDNRPCCNADRAGCTFWKLIKPRIIGSIAAVMLALALTPTSANSQATQALERIEQAVHDYLNEHIGGDGDNVNFDVKALDKRLKLAACAEKLVPFLPPGHRKSALSTVGVKCPSGKMWTVYVPVTVNTFETVVVAQHPLPRGHILSERDLTTLTLNVNELRGTYVTRLDNAVGKEVTRPLQSNAPIYASMLKAPLIIKRGQRVTLKLKTESLEISALGKALMDGAVGDVIRVENSKTKRVIEGEVSNQGIVEIRI